MASIIPSSAQIARENNRNALMVCFHKYNENIFIQAKLNEWQLKTYKLVRQFLVENGFKFYRAFPL